MLKKRTIEDERKIDEEYMKLTKNFHPQFGNEQHIRIAKKIGRVCCDERLMLKQKGKLAASNYKSKMYEGKISIISSLNYFNNQNK